MQITIYDLIMLVLVLYAAWSGWSRGMAWQVAPIASLVLAYIFAVPLSITLAPRFGEPPLNRLFALVALYAAISLAVYLVVRSFRGSLEKLRLEEFDRHLGLILGGVKGVLFTIAITLGLVSLFPSIRPTILESESSTIAARILHTIYPILPTAAIEIIDPYLKNLPAAESYANGRTNDSVHDRRPRDVEEKVPQDRIRDLPAAVSKAATDFLFGDREPAAAPQPAQPAQPSRYGSPVTDRESLPSRPRPSRTPRPGASDIPEIIQDGEFLVPPEFPSRRPTTGRAATTPAPSREDEDGLFAPLPPASRTSSEGRDRF